MQQCRCHSGKPYKDCCKKFHDGIFPEKAVELMRSRYSAYALGLVNYIIETTHDKNPRQKNFKEEKERILQFSKSVSFDGLEILEFIDGEKEAFVTFKATLKQGEHDVSFTEKSRFLKENGRWFYADGEIRQS